MRSVVILMILCVVLLILPTTSADNLSLEGFGLDEFDNSIEATPPSFETSAEEKINLSESDAQAALNESSATNTKIVLIEQKSGEHISEVHVLYNIDGEERIKFLEGDTLELKLDEGKHNIILKVDLLSTAGNDYYQELSMNAGEEIEAMLLAVGNLRGRVLINNKVIEEAQVKVECSGRYGEAGETTSDRYGVYRFDWLPVGECKISASKSEQVGYAQVRILAGEQEEVDVNLEYKKASTRQETIIIILVIMALIIIGTWHTSLRRKKNKKSEMSVAQEMSRDQRQEDLMKTLNAKEKKIVNFLLEQESTTATQGQIKNGTIIPKTSLSRILQGLENKKFITVEKIGKMKRVRLSSFFLGNEK